MVIVKASENLIGHVFFIYGAAATRGPGTPQS